MISLIVLAALQPQTVTLEQVAMPLDRMLVRLGEATGLDLRCADDFRNDPIVISVREEPVQEVLDRIAEVSSGRWSVGQGIYTLAPLPVGEKGDPEYQERVRAISEVIAANNPGGPLTAEDAIKFFDALEATVSADGHFDYIKSQEVAKQHPWAVGLYRVAALIGPEALAAVPEDSPVVFSSSPTQYQKPLPSGAAGAIEQQMDDLRVFDRVREGRNVTAQNAPAPIRHYFSPVYIQDQKPYLLWVKVRRFASSLSFDMVGFLRDEKAQPLRIAGSFEYREADPAQGLKAEFEWPEVTGELTLSEDAAEWSRWWASLFSASGVENEPEPDGEPLYWRVLTGEDGRDYLGFSHSEALLAGAKQLGRPLIARLDPAGHEKGYRREHTTLSLKSVWTSAGIGCRAYQDGRWLLAKPLNLAESRRWSIRRTAVAAMLHNSEPMGEIQVADLLGAADDCPSAESYRAALEFVHKAQSKHLRSVGYPEIEAIYLAGLMAPVNESRLLNEGEESVSQNALSHRAQDVVLQLLARNFRLIDTQGQAYLNAAKHMTPEELASFNGFDQRTPLYEPTWLLAQPGMSPYEITFSYQREDLFRRKAPSGPMGDVGFYSLRDMAREAALKQRRNEAGIPASPYDVDYVYSHEPVAQVVATIRFGGRHQGRLVSQIMLRPNQSDFHTPANLPEPFAKQFADQVKVEYERLKGVGVGGNPPPPTSD